MKTSSRGILAHRKAPGRQDGLPKFKERLFEAGMTFAVRKVPVVYDPVSLGEIKIRMKDADPATAQLVTVGLFCGYAASFGSVDSPTPEDSRLLKALVQARAARQGSAGIATSFASHVKWRAAAMYESFFSMKHTPSTSSIPTASLYLSQQFEEALGHLACAANKQMFAVVT